MDCSMLCSAPKGRNVSWRLSAFSAANAAVPPGNLLCSLGAWVPSWLDMECMSDEVQAIELRGWLEME